MVAACPNQNQQQKLQAGIQNFWCAGIEVLRDSVLLSRRNPKRRQLASNEEVEGTRRIMANVINVVLLLCAILTCLALGVAIAYSLCSILFAALRPSDRIVAAPAQAKAKLTI